MRQTARSPARPLAELLLLGYGPRQASEAALRGIAGIEHAYIAGSWAARYLGHNGEFPHDIDVVLIGSPDRDDATEALVDAMRRIGQDVQVVFRSPRSWKEAHDAFTRTAKSGPLVELELTELTGSVALSRRSQR